MPIKKMFDYFGVDQSDMPDYLRYRFTDTMARKIEAVILYSYNSFSALKYEREKTEKHIKYRVTDGFYSSVGYFDTQNEALASFVNEFNVGLDDFKKIKRILEGVD